MFCKRKTQGSAWDACLNETLKSRPPGSARAGPSLHACGPTEPNVPRAAIHARFGWKAISTRSRPL
eukprot:1950808-Prymnesium_polylepis.1